MRSLCNTLKVSYNHRDSSQSDSTKSSLFFSLRDLFSFPSVPAFEHSAKRQRNHKGVQAQVWQLCFVVRRAARENEQAADPKMKFLLSFDTFN
jgi:hypothetical protein